MTEYKFDTDARIRAWIEAESEEKAVDQFADFIKQAGEIGMKIDVSSYSPEGVSQ